MLKRGMAVFCFTLLFAVNAQSAVIMNSSQSNTGNQFHSAVGLEFVVHSSIQVSELGVYDHGSNSISGSATLLSTVLFNAAQTSLAQRDFTLASPGTFDAGSNYLFKALDTLLSLAPGTYTLAAYGFNSSNLEHNSKNGGSPDIFNTGGGLISHTKDVWSTSYATAPSFPTNTDGNNNNYFGGPNMKFDASPVPAPGALCLALTGVMSAVLPGKRTARIVAQASEFTNRAACSRLL